MTAQNDPQPRIQNIKRSESSNQKKRQDLTMRRNSIKKNENDRRSLKAESKTKRKDSSTRYDSSKASTLISPKNLEGGTYSKDVYKMSLTTTNFAQDVNFYKKGAMERDIMKHISFPKIKKYQKGPSKY